MMFPSNFCQFPTFGIGSNQTTKKPVKNESLIKLAIHDV